MNEFEKHGEWIADSCCGVVPVGLQFDRAESDAREMNEALAAITGQDGRLGWGKENIEKFMPISRKHVLSDNAKHSSFTTIANLGTPWFKERFSAFVCLVIDDHLRKNP